MTHPHRTSSPLSLPLRSTTPRSPWASTSTDGGQINSLACLALPPVLQALPGRRPAHSALVFPSNSFFGVPLAVAAGGAAALSPAAPLPRSLTVFAAGKGYKMKTHKASAKRFRVTGTGKIVRRCAGKQHLLSKKNAKRRKRLSKMVQVNKSDYSNVMGALPYLKVNKKAG